MIIIGELFYMYFKEYYDMISGHINWAENIIKNYKNDNNSEIYKKLQAFERDCRVACRKVEIISKKYKSEQEIPPELYKEIKFVLQYTAFNKKDRISTSLDNAKN